MVERRYPLAALVAASGLSEAALARKIGLSGSTLKKARDRGFLIDAADRYAVRAGLHPEQVWGEDFGLPLCADPKCARPFVPTRKGHRFCSPQCRQRVLERAKYHTDPTFAERKRASRRRYYAECADYEKARERRRYHANREDAAA